VTDGVRRPIPSDRVPQLYIHGLRVVMGMTGDKMHSVTEEYRNIIVRVVSYGCETWSLKLKEERRMRVFENGVLRRIFGPERDEVTGE